MTKYLLGFLFLTVAACQSPEEKPETQQANDLEQPITAQIVVDSAIAHHGMRGLHQSKVSLDFRDKHYEAVRNGGHYDYFRIFTDEQGLQINDHVANNGFVRTINGDTANIATEKASAYSQSVNSVIYFALLPYFLNDGAVNKTYLGLVEIKQRAYHKIKVTFSPEGGGQDADDIFLYWFDAQTYQMNYLAYQYHTDGGGMRFREAYNTRTVNGVKIADYVNWKAPETIDFINIEQAFAAGQLEELSKIALENVSID